MSRVRPSTARRPYADQQALAWAFGIAIVAAMVFAGIVGYLIGSAP
jgi:hypothetical protein